MQTKDDILSYLIEVLLREVPATVVKTWFDDVSIVSASENTLVLQTSTEFKRGILLERYSSLIKQAMFELFGTVFTLDVRLSKDGKVVVEGRPKEIFNNEVLHRVFDMDFGMILNHYTSSLNVVYKP